MKLNNTRFHHPCWLGTPGTSPSSVSEDDHLYDRDDADQASNPTQQLGGWPGWDGLDGWDTARTTSALLSMALGCAPYAPPMVPCPDTQNDRIAQSSRTTDATRGASYGPTSTQAAQDPSCTGSQDWVNAHGQNAFRTSPLQGDNATASAENPNGKGPQGDKVFAQNSLILVGGENSLAPDNPSPDQYTTNADGTFTDSATGLTWTQPQSMTYEEAEQYLAAHPDLDLPTMDQLVSLSNSEVGAAPSSQENKGDLFTTAPIQLETPNGDMSQPEGQRVIDGQVLSKETAQGSIMGQEPGNFKMGYNFADGRIKAYPLDNPPGSGQAKPVNVMFVKKDEAYEQSLRRDFVSNSDGTVTEQNSGTTYTQKDAAGILEEISSDPALAQSWEDFYNSRMQDYGIRNAQGTNVSGVFNSVEATAFADWANSVNLYGRSDWRVPNLKEMHHATVNDGDPETPGLDPIFDITQTIDPYTNEPMWGNYQTSDRITDWVPVLGPDGQPALDSNGRPMFEQQVSATYIASGSADGRRPNPEDRPPP